MKQLVAVVVLAATVGIAAKGCLSKDAPDEQLVSKIHDICDIARDNVTTPNDGVTKLGSYLADHAGDMYKHVVDTVALVSQITDEAKLEKRGNLARERWSEAAEECYPDWVAFAEAVDNDPKASARVDAFQHRLEHAIEVIFQGSAFRDLPRAFSRYLTTSFHPAPSVPRPVPPAGVSYEN